MGDRGTGSAGCLLHVLCVGRIPGIGQGRPPCRRCRQKTTPAMAAGVADHVWSLTEIVALLDSNDDSNLPTTRRPAARPLGRRWCGRMPSQSSVPLESRRPPTSASDSGDSPDPTPTPNPRSGRSGRLDLPPAQVTRTTFSLILSLIYVRLPGSITVYYRSLSRLNTSVWPVLDGRPSS
jgi:hypothetical protein